MAARTPLLIMTWPLFILVLTPSVSVASFVMFSVINILSIGSRILLDSRMLAIMALFRIVFMVRGQIAILSGKLVASGVLPASRIMSPVIGSRVRILRRVHLLSFSIVMLPLWQKKVL